MSVRLSAFPKCYLEAISLSGTMTVFDWIGMAKDLDADGLEMYEGFFTSWDNEYLDSVAEAASREGFAVPMLCCSPDFTQPDATARERAIEKHARMIQATRRLGGPNSVCRILSGQRHPEAGREEGIEWVVGAIEILLPVAREHGVILGFENHYKDGFWRYPEFAQRQDIFLEILNRIPPCENFGVQYDPSNAIVAGDDPVELLRLVADRVVSMHASDRYFSPAPDRELRHGVTGKGINDYPAIFQILADHQFDGWISIEDGMNGMDEMRESLAFLRRMVSTYFR